MKVCHLKFDAKYCTFKQNVKKPINEQIEFCRHLKCPHGTVMEREINGETIAFVSCDLSWNAFANRETTNEERELTW